MEWNDNVYELWMLLNVAMLNQAVWFAACAFLIWVGFRFTNNIYNTSTTPIFAKVLTTAFCLSVAMFTLNTFMQVGSTVQGIGEAFSLLADTGVELSLGAQNIVSRVGGAMVLPVQWVFIVSVVVMQLAQIWMKKS